MIIAVTGSSGFIGNSFRSYFSKKFDCIPIQRKFTKNNWSYYIDSKIEGISLLHAGDQSKVSLCEEEGQKGLSSAVDNLKLLLDKNPSKVIYLSSCLVYKINDGEDIYSEESVTEDSSWYTRRKLESEEIVLDHPNGVVLRMSNVYGKKNISNNIFGDIDKQITNDSPMIVTVRSLNPVRDFIYIDDIMNALDLLFLENSSGVYNLGSGVGTSVKQIIKLIASHKKVEIGDIQASGIQDNSRIIVDTKKLQNDFSWVCNTSISEGIKKILISRR